MISALAFLVATGPEVIPPNPAIEALGWMLVHFVWQGAVAALALVPLLAFARRRSPQVRYLAGCVTLSLMALTAFATFAWQLGRAERDAAAAGASAELLTSARSREFLERPQKPLLSPPRVRPNKRAVQDAIDAAQRLRDAQPTPARRASVSGEPLVGPSNPVTFAARQLGVWTEQIGRHLPSIVLLWMAGVGLLSVRLATGWTAIRRLRAASWELDDPNWAERFARLREGLGISPAVRLMVSASATVPLVVGWIKPIVLLPAGMLTGLTVSQVEALLVHELAHIHRHDYLLNLAQTVIETLFFYHPAVWWVSQQIRKEREHCCDDIAATACGTLDYAQALASLAELRQIGASLGLAVNGAPLIERIRRLAGVETAPRRTAGWVALAALIVLGIIALQPADRSRAAAQNSRTVKGTVLVQGRPLAAGAEVSAESQDRACGSAETNAKGEFQMQVPATTVIDAYRVSLPHSFAVSFTLDKRAPLALAFQRLTAPAKVERQEPLVLTVEWKEAWGASWPYKVPQQNQSGSLPPVARIVPRHVATIAQDSPKSPGFPEKSKPRESSPRTTGSAQPVRRVSGRVLDHEDKPVADAHVWWFVFDRGVRKPTVLADCACDAAGRFRLEIPADGKPPATRPNDGLWALAPGRQPHAVGETEKLQVTEGPATREMSSEIVIQLDPAPDFLSQVNDAAGRPIAGATLERLWCGQHFPGAFLDERCAEPEWPAPFRERDLATTDAMGVAHFCAHSGQYRIAARDCGIQTIEAPSRVPRVFPIGGKARPVGEKSTITLCPVGRVEGAIFAADSRFIRGRKLQISTFWVAGENLVEGSATVTSDAHGRFVVPAIAEGMLRYKFLDAPADPSLVPMAKAADVRANETTRLEIHLRTPTLANGLVQADATGEPIAGAEIFLGGGFELGTKLTADEHGRFRAPLADRSVSLQAIRIPDESHADYQKWYSFVRPGKTRASLWHAPSLYKVIIRGSMGGSPIDVPAIVRIPSKFLEGTVVDANGRHIPGAWVEAKDGLGRYVATSDAQGTFEFQVPKAVKFDSINVSLQGGRTAADVRVEHEDPLVLKVSFTDEPTVEPRRVPPKPQ